MNRQPQAEVLRIKRAVRDRDGNACTKCGISAFQYVMEHGRNMDVHRLTPGGAYSLDGCVTLCVTCHGPELKRKHGARLIEDGVTSIRLADDVSELIQKYQDKFYREHGVRLSRCAIVEMAIRKLLRQSGLLVDGVEGA